MMRMLMVLGAVVVVGLSSGCTGSKVKIDQAALIGAVAQGAQCVQAVQTTANDPVCRAPLAPCRAAYEAGRNLVNQ